MTTVVAALIRRNAKLLICQRRKTDSFALQWEFPGGKVRAGETPAEALARELREELGVVARIGRELYRTRHRYTELPGELELIFFAAGIDEQPVRNLAFEQFLWAEPSTLLQYAFLPADRELITLLSSGTLRL